MAKYGDVKKTFQQILNEWNHVDILVNNAGVILASYLVDANEDEIESLFNINVLSHCWVSLSP